MHQRVVCISVLYTCLLSKMSRLHVIAHFFEKNSFVHIFSDMKANNYEVVEAGDTITFQGLVKRSTSQAFFLVFCTLLGLASLALVLQIQFQDLVLPGMDGVRPIGSTCAS